MGLERQPESVSNGWGYSIREFEIYQRTENLSINFNHTPILNALKNKDKNISFTITTGIPLVNTMIHIKQNANTYYNAIIIPFTKTDTINYTASGVISQTYITTNFNYYLTAVDYNSKQHNFPVNAPTNNFNVNVYSMNIIHSQLKNPDLNKPVILNVTISNEFKTTNATLFYKNKSDTVYKSLSFLPKPDSTNYSGSIEIPQHDIKQNELSYYIQAHDINDTCCTLPFNAPENCFILTFTGMKILHNPVYYANLQTSLEIKINIENQFNITNVILFYKNRNEDYFKSQNFSPNPCDNNYSGKVIIPKEEILKNEMYYYIQADDITKTVYYLPAAAPLEYFTIKIDMPTSYYKLKSKIFTPNNDGFNDVLDFNNFNGKIKIFNVQGKLIYTIHNGKWDGRFKNKSKIKSGVYIYQFQYHNKINSDFFLVVY